MLGHEGAAATDGRMWVLVTTDQAQCSGFAAPLIGNQNLP